jgi:hypothetical protein
VADLLAGKLDHDEQDEMAIFTLEQQLSEVKGQLGQAKFKYESRQLYELDQKEKNLKDRLAQAHQAQQQNKNYEDLQRKIRDQKAKMDKMKREEDMLSQRMWQFEREQQLE